MVIHVLSNILTDIKNVWICSKHLWFGYYAHPSFIFLHLSVFPSCHNFPSIALYPHGAIEEFVLAVPYVNISDISEFYQPHIRSI